MEQKIVKRRLVVGAEVESYLAKVFGCSYRMIKKAMYLSENGVAAWLLHLLYIDEIASVYRRS